MGAPDFGEAPGKVLEAIATGTTLSEALHAIVGMIESRAEGMLCSILLLDPSTRTLRHGAAPHLPPAYLTAIDGEVIGPTRGSCGAAAFLEETVVVEDIETHPNWADFRHLALPHGLRACWSTPIVSPEREVLGTFAMYYLERRAPTHEERSWVATATHLAAIAIVRDRAERALKAREARALELATLHGVAGAVSQATLGMREPRELYEFACRTAVENRLVDLAWIGAHREAEGHIEPLVRFGRRSDSVQPLSLGIHAPGDGKGPAARAIRGAVAVSRIDTDPGSFQHEALAGFKSCAVFPLRLDEKTRGIFALYSERADLFRSEEVNVLAGVADNLSFAAESLRNEIARRELFQALAERERRLRLTQELGDALRDTLEPEAILPVALRMLGEHLNACRCAYVAMDDDSDAARVLHEYIGPGAPSIARDHRPSDFAKLRGLLSTIDCVVIEDTARDLPREEADMLLQLGVRALVVRALVRDEKLRAVMTVNSAEPRHWLPAELELIEEFVERCWTAIERRTAETKLRRSEALLRIAGRAARLGGWSVELPGHAVSWSDQVCELHGVPPGTQPTLEEAIAFYAPDFREVVRENVMLCGRLGTPFDFEAQLVVGDTRRWVRSIGHAERAADGRITRIQGAIQDIDDQRKLEEQLRHSQKMEGIGQLAGGVAHDFNNLLSVILSYASLILEELPADNPLRPEIEEIQRAGVRATELTRQLLAFSRKQLLQPRVLDLNQVVTGLERMLRRTVSENVKFVFAQATPLGRILADPGQIEQVLMNLVVNARDAMPNGGTLTVETANVVLDASRAAQSPESKPGRYVRLAVSDTGMGMDAATRARIFEPFFTTKASGKGTGLGLSTVYGIVTQSGGHVSVQSAPGLGTTFELRFPRLDEKLDSAPAESPAGTSLHGTETILLVEDEAQLRAILNAILTRAGYRVLEAPNGASAIELAERSSHEIDLLLTDVVMPGMNGRVLAERMQELGLATRVLFMSGYTEDSIVQHGVEVGEIAFLPKPITPDALLRKVREVLAS